MNLIDAIYKSFLIGIANETVMICIFLTLLSISSLSLAQQVDPADAESVQPFFDLQKDFEYNINLQNDLVDKLATLDVQGAIDNYFNVTGVATTPLGSLAAFFGDLSYPVLLGCVTIFGLFIAFQIMVQVFGAAFNIKFGALTSFLNWVTSAQKVILEKLVTISTSDEDETEMTNEERSQRSAGFATQKQIMKLLSHLSEAIEKYQ